MQTAGLVLDLYDAPKDIGSIFTSVDEVPEQVKEAHLLSPQELGALPDDVFALVLMNGDDRLRKYACTDEGNTLLNIAYFFKHGSKLPEVAQKTAAENLVQACNWYGIEVAEDLQKVALGLGTVASALTLPSVIKGSGSQMKSNLAATREAGSVIMTPREQSQVGAMLKGAEATGTSLMPSQDPGDLSTASVRGKPGSSNTSAMKSASIEPDVVPGVAGRQYQRAPQTPLQSLRPHVAVHNHEPAKKLIEKKAQYHAIPGVFPLDSYTQVQAASQYFDDNYRAMEPEMRHEFAVNMVKRASAMGIDYSDLAASYGSTTFASEESIKIALDTRRPHLTEKQAAVLDALYSHRAELGPEQFCDTLAEFDKLAELEWRYDRAVPDPYASTYGLQKTAADEGNSWTNGNDYITKKQIENYGVTAAHTLKDDYGEDFAKEFRKDPWGIFNSLPVDQKRRIARAAGDNGATGMYDVQ
jgi:hypothetical protein